MAQVRGTAPQLYDNIDKVVFSVVETTSKQLPAIWKQTYRVLSSKRKFERRLQYAQFDSVPLKGEGDDYNTKQIRLGNSVDFTHLEFGLGFEVTETAEEDDQFDVIAEHAAGLMRAARWTEEVYAASPLNLGFSTQTSPDGAAWFSASHSLITGGTCSNLITDDLSVDSLMNAIILMATDAKSEEGHNMALPEGFQLIVPPASMGIAERVVKSSGLPGSADNDVNPLKKYGVDIIVNPLISDTDSWFVLAKGKNHGLLSYTRVRMGLKPMVRTERADNRLYRLRFRRSWGVDRWQGAVGSQGA
jgi:hypothetical protein